MKIWISRLSLVAFLLFTVELMAEEKPACPNCDSDKACAACSEVACSECKILCPVSGKPAADDVTAKYRGGEVRLCCSGCVGVFAKDPAKFASKANYQLVATKQAVQVACPFSGGKLDPEAATEVQGTKVAFCCNGCKGKAEKAKGDDQLALLFSDKAFEKGFKMQPKKDSQE
jgi:hypothetical protein